MPSGGLAGVGSWELKPTSSGTGHPSHPAIKEPFLISLSQKQWIDKRSMQYSMSAWSVGSCTLWIFLSRHNIIQLEEMLLSAQMILLQAALLLVVCHAFQSSIFHHYLQIHRSCRHDCNSSSSPTSLFLSSSDIQAKLRVQMAKLQERDRASVAISPDVSTSCFGLNLNFHWIMYIV